MYFQSNLIKIVFNLFKTHKNTLFTNKKKLFVFSGVYWKRSLRPTKYMNTAKLIKYCQNKTVLCNTLRELNISDTCVTDFGFLRAYLNVFNLETLGNYSKLGKSIEILDAHTIISPKLQLTMVNLYRTSTEGMQIISNVCTNLKKIVINGPPHTPFTLSILPNTITKIHLNHIPVNYNWLTALYTCLPSKLQELSLKFPNNSDQFTLDLGNLLFRLVSLRMLIIDGIETTLQSNPLKISLRNLEKICITNIDNSNTLQHLLKCTPGLEILHVFSCKGLYNSSIINLLQTQNNFHLRCFYINYLSGRCTNTISHLVKLYPEIINIGNVDNWGISRENLEALNMKKQKHNIKLEFHGSSHWYQSECFQP